MEAKPHLAVLNAVLGFSRLGNLTWFLNPMP